MSVVTVQAERAEVIGSGSQVVSAHGSEMKPPGAASAPAAFLVLLARPADTRLVAPDLARAVRGIDVSRLGALTEFFFVGIDVPEIRRDQADRLRDVAR